MYTTREKPSREEFHKSRKNHNTTPSFSSTLLDEIYRSIDGKASKPEDFEAYGEKKPSKRHGEISSFRRACLVEKWIEKEAIPTTKKPTMLQDSENDFMFFSSTSSSSDSSGALSSSDTEFFGPSSVQTTKPKTSCFSARLKPVKTGAHSHQTEKNCSFRSAEKNCSFLSDDCRKKTKKTEEDDDLMKSKSRALRIYANLKKVKQPISPGGRLTSFINSLFSNANGKKSSKNVQDLNSQKYPSTCSSASSFSRSCLSKSSPNSRERMRNGAQRTVRFHPVSVIVDEDSRPCGQKCTYDDDQDSAKLRLCPSLSKSETTMQRSMVVEGGLKGYNGKINDHKDEEDEEEEDCMSDSSSDLFELDHLSLFGDKRYCEELPVYETTHFDTNRAIASGLIR